MQALVYQPLSIRESRPGLRDHIFELGYRPFDISVRLAVLPQTACHAAGYLLAQGRIAFPFPPQGQLCERWPASGETSFSASSPASKFAQLLCEQQP
jgi:hypothetical protein